jgi:DNA polymerase-3 subunit gamma/tau
LDELLTVLHNVSLFQILPEAAAAKQADSRLVRELASVLGKEDVQLYYQIGLLGKRDLPLAPDPASGFEMTLLRMLTFSPEGEPDLGGDAAESQAKKSVSSSGGQNIGVAREVQPKNSASSNATTPMRRAVAQSGATDKGHLGTPSLSDPAVWATFVEDSAFTGVTRELAMNLCPESYDSKNQVLTLSLMPGLASMRSPSRQKSLEKKLEAFYGSSVRVEIAEDGKVSGETPAMVQVRREQEEKDQAFKTLMDDPAVQGLVSAFDATAVPESVTPGKQQRKIE